MAKERSSNFELLRIVSMIMIVFYHFAFYSGFNYDFLSANNVFLNFLELFGKVGVNVFLLISGYFLIRQDIKISKLVKLWMQIFTYSVLIYIYFVIIRNEPFSLIVLLKNVMPISFDNWWFASAYFLLYLFSPFLNKLLRSLTQRQYIAMMVIVLMFWCVLRLLTAKEIQGNHLLEFFFVYSIGGYIKLYSDNRKYNSKILWVLLIVTILLDLSAELLLRKVAWNHPYMEQYIPYIRNEMSPFTLLLSILVFVIFKQIKIGSKKHINLIASASFGVYLIHDNASVRTDLWKGLINGSELQNSIYLVPYTVAVCLGVYAACTIIELARIYLLEKNYMKLVYKAEPKINRVLHKLVDSVYEKIR